MTPEIVMSTLREALMVALKLAGPLLLVSVVIGLVISIFQATTQIHEQTLTFVPKILAIAAILLGMGAWMITMLGDFMKQLFRLMTQL